jgi:hypothetical protein
MMTVKVKGEMMKWAVLKVKKMQVEKGRNEGQTNNCFWPN